MPYSFPSSRWLPALPSYDSIARGRRYVVTGNVGGLFNRFLVTVGQMNSEDFGCWFVNTLWRLPKKV